MLVRLLPVFLLFVGFVPQAHGRHDGLESTVRTLLTTIEGLRGVPTAERQATLWKMAERVDTEAWLQTAIGDWSAVPTAARARLGVRLQTLLVARAEEQLDAPGTFRIEIEKTRMDDRHRAVDCLVHTRDAIYEIGLRWSLTDPARLEDVLLEGVSIGQNDRRQIARAWRKGGEEAVLAMLDRAIARIGVKVDRPIAMQTTSPNPSATMSGSPIAAPRPVVRRRPPNKTPR